MLKNCLSQKKSYFSCRNCCLSVFFIGIFFCVVTHQVCVLIAESTIFLKTDNISLRQTYNIHSLIRDNALKEEVKNTYFIGRDNILLSSCHHNNDFDNIALLSSGYNPKIQSNGKIILRESDRYLVWVEKMRIRGFGLRTLNPTRRFENMSRFTFYRIHKELSKDDSYDVKTEFLGTIETNMYGAWVGNTQKISISTDGKYIIMEAYAVNSRSLGKFRNKEVLLIWEIGEKTEIRPITDSQGNDIPITIIEPSE